MHRLICLVSSLLLAATLHAQPSLDSLLNKSTRVALIPPANLSGTAAAATVVTAALRASLGRKANLADSAAVAAVMREHRIRNTAELGSAEVQLLARELEARYLFVGSIDRYQAGDSSAELALSARLIDAISGNVVWINHANAQADRRTRLLMLGKTAQPPMLAKPVARQLCKTFRLAPRRGARHVRALHAPAHRADVRACRRIAVLVMGNESATHFAGHIVTNQLLATLHQAGFATVDPGRVREVMLAARELTQGEMSAALLARCHDELGADFLLTGSISEYTCAHTSNFDAPSAAFETRLIDTARGDLLWAHSYARAGKDSALLFNLGYIHGLTDLSYRMARETAHDLRHLRSRTTPLAPEPHP